MKILVEYHKEPELKAVVNENYFYFEDGEGDISYMGNIGLTFFVHKTEFRKLEDLVDLFEESIPVYDDSEVILNIKKRITV